MFPYVFFLTLTFKDDDNDIKLCLKYQAQSMLTSFVILLSSTKELPG